MPRLSGKIDVVSITEKGVIMAMYKSAEDFLVLSMKTAEQYGCWLTEDCAAVLLETLKIASTKILSTVSSTTV